VNLRDTVIGRLYAGQSLTARFAVHSFVCIGLMTAALWLLVSSYLINQILQHEWQATARIVQGEVKKFLEEYDFTAQDRKSVGHKFVALLNDMRQAPDIVHFRVYNAQGVVIWSDDKQTVGKSFADRDELRKALRGQIVADMRSGRKNPDAPAPAFAKGTVEVYVPVFADNGRELLGVFETYKRADSIYSDMREARMVVLLGALGGGMLLYLSLFAIVRKAARKIDEQQENLLKMHSELVASQRMAAVGEMAAAVAHGIGNPLSSIRAAAQVAMLDAGEVGGAGPAGKMKENLQGIIQQVDRVQKRMQGLLNFAKPLEPHAVPLEVNSLLRDVVESLRARFDQAAVVPQLDLGDHLPKVMSDANHLEQIFMGLITNAVEATPRGGRVTVRSKAFGEPGNGREVRVSIEDTGEGIPAENRERVFEPFFTTKPQGTGIGLPLAKKFVERNGGAIKICDTKPPGTRIDITLPVAN
jgi:signal transduction histidine kinase